MATKRTLQFKLDIVKTSDKISLRQAERLYGVNRKTIAKWKLLSTTDNLRESAQLSAKALKQSKINSVQRAEIIKILETEPEISGRELIERLNLNCSIKTILKIKKSLVTNKSEPVSKECWLYSCIKLAYKNEDRALYLLSAIECQSGVTLISLATENIPLVLENFISKSLLFIKKIASGKSFKVIIKTNRFGSSWTNKDSVTIDGFSHIEFQYDKEAECAKYLVLKKKLDKIFHKNNGINISPAGLLNIQFNINLELVANTRYNMWYKYISFQPLYLDIHYSIRKPEFSESNSIDIKSLIYTEAEIAISSFNLERAQKLTNVLLSMSLETELSNIFLSDIQRLLAQLSLYGYDYDKARIHLSNAVEMANSSNDDNCVIKSAIAMSDYLTISSQYKRSEQLLLKALNLCQKHNFKTLECQVLGKVGRLYKIINNPGIDDIFEKQLKIALEIDDKKLYCQAMNNIGLLYLTNGYYDKGLQCSQKSLAVAQKAKYLDAILEANLNMAEYALRGEKFMMANEFLQESMKHIDNSEYRPLYVKSIVYLGYTLCRLNNTSEGIATIDRGLLLAKLRNDRFSESLAYNLKGEIFLDLKDFKKAAFFFNKALKINEIISSMEQQIVIYGNLSICYNELKRYSHALAFAKKRLDIVRRTGNKLKLSSAYSTMAFCAFSSGKYEQAIESFKFQLKSLKGTDANLQKALALSYLGITFLEMKDYQQAAKFYHKAELKFIALENNFYLSHLYLDLARIMIILKKTKQCDQYIALTKEKATLSNNSEVLMQLADLIAQNNL